MYRWSQTQRHSGCFSLHPSLAAVEIKTIPFDVSPVIWGGTHGFPSGVVKYTVAAGEASLGFRQMEFSSFSSVFFFPLHFVIYLFVSGCRARGVGLRTQDKEKTICF